MTNFYISVNLEGNPDVPLQSPTFQIVTPWGQTSWCHNWYDAVQQAFQRHGLPNGQMGNYFKTGTTNGLTMGSAMVPQSANDIIATD